MDSIHFVSDLEGRLLTPKEGCGYSKVAHKKIVGGTTAEVGAWPWMSLVIYKNEKGFFSNCGKVYNPFILYLHRIVHKIKCLFSI